MIEKRRAGRPRSDQFARRLEIYRAVGPLVLERGARRLTMRDAARAASISPSALYHYFPTKRDLLVFPLLPEVCEQMFARFESSYRHLRRSDPEAYLAAFVELMVEGIMDVRPAMHAAVELGAGEFWWLMREGIDVELTSLVAAAQRARGPAHVRDSHRLTRALRRAFLGAALDWDVTDDEIRRELVVLIDAAASQNGRHLGDVAAVASQRG